MEKNCAIFVGFVICITKKIEFKEGFETYIKPYLELIFPKLSKL